MVRARRAVSLGLGALVACLVVIAVRDVRTIIRLSNEDAALLAAAPAAGRLPPVVPNAPSGGGGDTDLVWVGGGGHAAPPLHPPQHAAPATAPHGAGRASALPVEKKPLLQPTPPEPPHAPATAPPHDELTPEELKELADAVKHFEHPEGHASAPFPHLPPAAGESAAAAGWGGGA